MIEIKSNQRIIPPYHSQRNNTTLDGKPDPATQCGIATGTMLLRSVGIATNRDLAQTSEAAYLSNLTAKLQKGETRFDWEPHRRLINGYLSTRGISAEAVSAQWGNIGEAMDRESPVLPVFMGLNIAPVLPGAHGHFVLALRSHFGNGLDVHDPFGDANTGYRNANGECVWYSGDLLRRLAWNYNPNVIFIRSIL